MIRGRDQIRLSLQKLRLRKRRAAFAIVSVALGVVVIVMASSLMDGIRNVAVTTLWTEELDRDVIRVSTSGNEYDFGPYDDEPVERKKTKKRHQFLTEALFEEMRGWPGVEAADRPIEVDSVRLHAWEKRPRPVTALRGVPEALLRRYAVEPDALRQTSNAIPLVVGERLVRLRYEEKTRKLEFDPAGTNRVAWLGREVAITLGDNYTNIRPDDFDHRTRQFTERDAGDVTAQRDALERNLRTQFDLTIYNTTLTLRGRVVGLRPGSEILVPLEAAALCDRWLDQRRRLAALRDLAADDSSSVHEARGRRTPRAGEFREGLVVVAPNANIEAIAKRIDEMGFYAATRARVFENQAKAFDGALRVVKMIAHAFGGALLGLACGLMWSTTSRIVSDSRADIGLFRALGATKGDIRRLFLGESVLLGTLGTLTGMLIGWALAMGLSHWVISWARSETYDPEEALLIPDTIFSIDVTFSFLLLLGAAAISLLAGLWPATRAANVDPVKALKRE
jgi:hypothetical protein